RFLKPEIGVWLLMALVLAGLLRVAFSRRFAASTAVRWLVNPSYRASWVRRLPLVLLVAALVLIAAALMEPAIPSSLAEVRSRGLDIVMVLDLSSSMQEEMDSPALPNLDNLANVALHPRGKTRLEATKDAIKTFVRGRHDDRIGLVVFSDNAYVVSPLTFDYDYLLHYVDMVDDRILQGEGQTAIGDGLALA